MKDMSKNNIYGVVEKTKSNKDYTGVKTDTAQVNVDNVKREISVDVIASGILGETNTTAYPGNSGALNRSLILDLQKDLSAEEQRATESEGKLQQNIDNVSEKLDTTASNLENNIKEESGRAQRAEEVISNNLSDLASQTDNRISELSQTIENTVENIESEIKELNDALTSSEEDIYHEINYIKDNYADKMYVYEQVANATKLSKQIVDSIDVENNTVTVGGVTSPALEGVMYFVNDALEEGSSNYRLYILVDGQLTMIGDTELNLDGYATEDYVQETVEEALKDVDLSDYAKKEDIPDVSSFIDKIPEEYITEAELESKNYCSLADLENVLKNIRFINGGKAPL